MGSTKKHVLKHTEDFMGNNSSKGPFGGHHLGGDSYPPITFDHRWPFGKIDGPGKWKKPNPKQTHLF